jgi:type IV pilus assembly protein PilA
VLSFGRVKPLLLAAIVLTLTALLPRRLSKSEVSRETRAMAAIRTIHTAETQYYSQYGHYAVTLRELAPLITGDLSSGTGSGYRLALAANPGGYIVSAVPKVFRDGSRTFYSDQTMVVREHYGPEPATPRDPESK